MRPLHPQEALVRGAPRRRGVRISGRGNGGSCVASFRIVGALVLCIHQLDSDISTRIPGAKASGPPGQARWGFALGQRGPDESHLHPGSGCRRDMGRRIFLETSRNSRTQIEGSTMSRVQWDCGAVCQDVFWGCSNPLLDFIVKAGIQRESMDGASDGGASAAQSLARSAASVGGISDRV